MPERISKNGTSVPNAERPSGVLLVDVSRGSSGWCDHLWLDFVVASVVVAVLVLVLVNSEIRVVYDAFPVRGQAEVFVFLAVVAPLRLLGSGRGRRGRNSFLRVVTHFQNCKQVLFEQIGFMTLVVASQSAVLCCRMGAWVVPGREVCLCCIRREFRGTQWESRSTITAVTSRYLPQKTWRQPLQQNAHMEGAASS